MATRSIVPRADEEGSLGTTIKKWGATHTKDLSVSGTGTGVTPVAGDNSKKFATTEFASEGAYPAVDSDRIYDGVDLSTKFATEISSYADVWAWIKARIVANNYTGIHIADYIPFTMNGNVVKAQIAGINTYTRTGDAEIGRHIDFISKDCYPANVPWNTTDVNNGNATNAAPWMVSNLKGVLNTTWYGYLPTGLKTQIIEKRSLIETRYTSGQALTDSTSWAWNDIGKLWVPTEQEVFGCVQWGTKVWGFGNSSGYPIFGNSWKNRMKGAGNGGTRCDWWLLSVYGGNSTYVCHVSYDGYASYTTASTSGISAPVCFRIG